MQLLNSNIPRRALTTRYGNKKAQDILNLVLFMFVAFSFYKDGGAKGIRTPDLLNAIQTRYQLRHNPVSFKYHTTFLSGCQCFLSICGRFLENSFPAETKSIVFLTRPTIPNAGQKANIPRFRQKNVFPALRYHFSTDRIY